VTGIWAVVPVKEFEGAADPQRQAFLTRPKMEGLWVNLRFRDGGLLEDEDAEKGVVSFVELP